AVDLFLTIEGQNPHGDLRAKAHHSPRKEITGRARHVRNAAVLDLLSDALDGARKDPGMPLPHRLFSPGLEDDGGTGSAAGRSFSSSRAAHATRRICPNRA